MQQPTKRTTPQCTVLPRPLGSRSRTPNALLSCIVNMLQGGGQGGEGRRIVSRVGSAAELHRVRLVVEVLIIINAVNTSTRRQVSPALNQGATAPAAPLLLCSSPAAPLLLLSCSCSVPTSAAPLLLLLLSRCRSPAPAADKVVSQPILREISAQREEFE